MTSNKHLVFVYGTLMTDETNHNLLENAECIAKDAWTFGYLYDTCLGYPGMVPNHDHKVYGEVYSISESELYSLDILEGYSPDIDPSENEYIRVMQDVYSENGIIQAYLYLYNKPIEEGMRRIPSGKWKERPDSQFYCELEPDAEIEGRAYQEYFQEEYQELHNRRRFMIRFLAVAVMLFVFAMVLGPWARIFHLPSMDLITKSRQLSDNPIVREWMRPVVTITTHNSKGTGFNIDANGLIVTNYHVIDEAELLFVTFGGGEMFRAEVVAEYPDIDLALLNINGKNLPVAILSSVLNVDMQKPLIVIGNPLGLTQIVVDGQAIGLMNIREWDKPVFVLESPILQGSSGSPVYNHKGEVVAVIFANAGTRQRDNGEEIIIGLAVPIDYLIEKDFTSVMSNYNDM